MSFKSNVLCCALPLWVICFTSVKGGSFQLNLHKNHKFSSEIDGSNEVIHNERIMWVQEMKHLRQHIKDCVQQTNDSIWNCFKTSSVRVFDSMLSSNVIALWPGIRLVRALTMPTNITNETEPRSISVYYERKDLQHLTWFDQLAMRLAQTLSTHFLQVNLRELTDAYMRALEKDANNKKLLADELGTARHRRQRYNMMITMMFGVTALGAVLVPMGFQMLSIVSGKALLLAKMALLLASINGLKKVANSGIHYGLYHVPGEHYGYYDRGDAPHHPRQVASFAIAQPVTEELGLKK
ncbi:PREDICTED: uncharacterized protein LOC108966905 isoform X2 [Bactrocera latifrons]|uniref:Uncharacterized protein n=1 Tax=Bactrocera latifrons TaxID=174628 RepID=A0A0K8TYI3_BACLA|nr:PREDICTED: uncharacterized protein LOC108966905 isoform X2 [Bactrocera latifrons]